MQDINADYPSLFNEKKNRELQKIAARSQASIVENIRTQAMPLFNSVYTAAQRSLSRSLNYEEGKFDQAPLEEMKTFGKALCAMG